MARKNIEVGDITGVSGEVSIAAGDIYKGYTAEQVSVLLTQITSTFQPRPFDGRCPYKGLDVFEEEDAGLFFGRERLVEDLVRRVEQSQTVFITGPSGSGKSSLVRAGLIPALKQGALKSLHSESWLYSTLKPGRDPIESTAAALSRLKSPELGRYFREHAQQSGVLHECAESVLSERGDQRLLLFLDQFEEVFTQINREEERATFLNLLTHAAKIENGRVILLFAMRSDFVSNCAIYPDLNDLLNQQFVQIGAMQPDELVSAIAQPALRVGLRIDPDLIAQIINDMEGEPGTLPLMQFALKDLFDAEQAQGGLIALTREAYLKRGGIHKSLERHANDAFARLSPSEQALAPSIFSGLIEIGRGTQDTRRTALFDELIPASANVVDVAAIVQKLADARLITTDEQAGKDMVTIAHEKLIDSWPWLKKLVNENRDAIALQNVIAADANQWEEHKRDPSYLYTGARLANVREQLQAKKLVLSGTAQKFVQAGRARQRRGRMILIAGVSGIIIILLIAVIEVRSQANANLVLAKRALARQLAAQAQLIYTTGNSKQMTAVLLAVLSTRITPGDPSDAAIQVLQNNVLARPVSTMAHDKNVYSVAFSPNGKYVVSGGWGGTARVWDASTGKEIARMTHDGRVNAVAFSPDGRYVVSGSDDGTARVWEALTGKEIARMTHEKTVYAVAFSPDGRYVISGSDDGTARVWDTATGVEMGRTTYEGGVNAVAFGPDGKDVVSGSSDDVVEVWEAVTGQEVARTVHEGSVNAVAFSPDGRFVVSGSDDGTARVWDARTGQQVSRISYGDVVSSVAFSSDGRYGVSGSWNHIIQVWDPATGREVSKMIHDSNVTIVAFSPDGKYVVSGSRDGTARVWEVATGHEVSRMTHDNRVNAVAFSPDGKFVVTGSEDGTARVWEITSPQVVARMLHEDRVWAVAFSPDGKYAVSGSGDHTARVWELASGKEVARVTHDDGVNAVAFSPDGKYVVSGSGDHTVRLWEATTGQEVLRMTHDGGLKSVAFSPDGMYVVSGSVDHTARVWDTATGREVARMTHEDEVRAVAFSPDGMYVVSGSLDHTLWMWVAETGQEVLGMTHDGSVNAVAFSPDGRYIASGSGDYTVRVWDVATGEEVARMMHDSNVRAVAFSPDGKYIVSGSRDYTVRVWELATGKEVTRIIHDNRVNAVSFSPDGKYIMTGTEDDFVRVWLWHLDDFIEEACARVTRNLTRAEWDSYLGDQRLYQVVCENLPTEPEDGPTETP